MWRRSTLGKLLRVKKASPLFFLAFVLGSCWILETQLDGSCFLAFGIIGIVSALLLTQRQIETFLRTFANFWQQEEEEERRRT